MNTKTRGGASKNAQNTTSSSTSVNQLSPNNSTNASITLEDIMARLQQVHSDMRTFQDDTNQKLGMLSEDIKSINNTTIKLEGRVNECERVSSNLSYEMELLKLKLLKVNVAIANVPIVKDENLIDIINKICDKLDAVEAMEHIVNYYRTKSGTIVLQLDTEQSKNFLIRKKKERKTLLVQEIGFPNSDKQVMINDHLTPFFGKLCYLARQAINKEEIFAFWMSNRGLCIKLAKDSEPVIVKDAYELQSLVVNKRKASADVGDNNPKKHK